MAEFIKIKKSDAELIMDFTKSSIINNYNLESNFYSIPKEDFEIIKKEFIISIRLEEKRLNKEAEGIDFSNLDKLVSEYQSKSASNSKNNYYHNEENNYSSEELFQIALMIAQEIKNIRKIPKLRNEIDRLIKKVIAYNLSYSIETIKTTFSELKNNGGTYEQYFNLKTLLESIIRKTYNKNISAVISQELEGNFLIKEDDQVYILNKSNAYMFSYGFIYSPLSIEKATNGEDDKIVPFNELSKTDYNIKLKKGEKPIGVYAITVGEKELSGNYTKAKSLIERSGVTSFIDVDLTKFLDGEDLEVVKNDFIKRMLLDSGIINETDIKDFYYDKLSIFFDRFMELKKKDYSTGNITNLFSDYLRYVFSQTYADPSSVLKEEKDLEGNSKSALPLDTIKEIFTYSIHYDFNIYTKKEVTNNDIALFVDKFYKYRDNRYLNLIYYGINNLLIYLHEIKDDNFDKVRDFINSKEPQDRDPWEISQKFVPGHNITKKEELPTYVDGDEGQGSRKR